MQAVKSAWYSYFRKMKAYEVKYSKADQELRRFKKEVVQPNLKVLSPTLKSILYEVRSPQLVEDNTVEDSAVGETNTHTLFSHHQPQTLQSASGLGTIGPGYTLALSSAQQQQLYPKEVEQVLATTPAPPASAQEVNPFTRAPTAQYLQSRPEVFARHERRAPRRVVPQQPPQQAVPADVSELGETFDVEGSGISKYKDILTPFKKKGDAGVPSI